MMGNASAHATAVLDDARFVRRIVQGDLNAFETLYDDLSPLVYGRLLHVVGDQGAAERLLVDTFFTAWSRVGTFRGDRAALPGWLLGIAHELAGARARRRHPVVSNDRAA